MSEKYDVRSVLEDTGGVMKRNQLAAHYGRSERTIKQWEDSGRLEDEGWRAVRLPGNRVNYVPFTLEDVRESLEYIANGYGDVTDEFEPNYVRESALKQGGQRNVMQFDEDGNTVPRYRPHLGDVDNKTIKEDSDNDKGHTSWKHRENSERRYLSLSTQPMVHAFLKNGKTIEGGPLHGKTMEQCKESGLHGVCHTNSKVPLTGVKKAVREAYSQAIIDGLNNAVPKAVKRNRSTQDAVRDAFSMADERHAKGNDDSGEIIGLGDDTDGVR